MEKPREIPPIDRIADLQRLVVSFAQVERHLNLGDAGRPENDVDHSFGLALTCWFLAPKIAPNLSLEKILTRALAHDLIEIYSGDTFVFDRDGKLDTKEERETASLERLKVEWQDFPEMIEAMEAYKDLADSEARFVYTIDKMLPSILVNLGERGEFWARNQVTRQEHEANKLSRMQSSPEALPYAEMLNDWMVDPDYFYKPNAGQQM